MSIPGIQVYQTGREIRNHPHVQQLSSNCVSRLFLAMTITTGAMIRSSYLSALEIYAVDYKI